MSDSFRHAIEAEQVRAMDMVERVLANDERARNNDLWLILCVWQDMQHIKLYVPYNKLKEMMPAETITRARRKIQHDKNLYPPTDDKVILRRRIKQRVLRNYFGRGDEW